MSDTTRGFLVFLVVVIVFTGLGFMWGFGEGGNFVQRNTEIRVFNGTAQMRLETQADNTVDWIEVEPYQVKCEPVE